MFISTGHAIVQWSSLAARRDAPASHSVSSPRQVCCAAATGANSYGGPAAAAVVVAGVVVVVGCDGVVVGGGCVVGSFVGCVVGVVTTGGGGSTGRGFGAGGCVRGGAGRFPAVSGAGSSEVGSRVAVGASLT